MHWPQAFVYRSELPDIFQILIQLGTFPDDDPDPLGPDGHHEVVEHPNVNETWAEMEKLLETGKVRAIGVSNFSVKTLGYDLPVCMKLALISQSPDLPSFLKPQRWFRPSIRLSTWDGDILYLRLPLLTSSIF